MMGPERWLPEQEADWAREYSASGIRTGPLSGVGRKCIFDVEGDGLLYAQGSKKQVTQVWCLAAVDIETGEEFYWGVDFENIEDGLRFLAECDLLIGHNSIGYDFPCLERLYPWWKRPAKSWDSMIVAKCAYPPDALIESDMARYRKGLFPGELLKRHSLKAWGYRTGTHKGDYKGGFDEWCPAMAVYLMGDVRSTLALWKVLTRKMGWTENPLDEATGKPKNLVWPERAIEVECKLARIIHEQGECGVRFDMDKAQKLAQELRNQQASIEAKLVEAFGSWWEASAEQTVGRTALSKVEGSPTVTVKRFSEKTGKELKPYVGPVLEERCEGDKYVNIEWTTFSPSNRHHLGKRLQEVYGWKPKKFGAKGEPTVDETTLEEIPEAVLPAHIRKLILDYFVVSKTYAMVSSGRKAWIALGQTGRVFGEVDTAGAVTRRSTHKNPNLSQVPGVKKEKGADGKEHVVKGLAGKFGWECRELFGADDGWDETGVDASSLELICLGHYLAPVDHGAFSARVCDPERDAHREHANLCGMLRADAKTAIYLKVYGGSAYKLSLSLSIGEEEEIPGYLCSKALPGLLRSLEKRMGEDFVKKLDDRQKAKIAKAQDIIKKLEGGIVGLKDLIKQVQDAAERGWLKGMDGSAIFVRKPYAALNTLLQSAGAVTCKRWLVLMHEELERRGYKKGVDWKQILFIHDEVQITHRPGLGPIILEVGEQTLVQAGIELGLRGRYRSDGKTGPTWAHCH